MRTRADAAGVSRERVPTPRLNSGESKNGKFKMKTPRRKPAAIKKNRLAFGRIKPNPKNGSARQAIEVAVISMKVLIIRTPNKVSIFVDNSVALESRRSENNSNRSINIQKIDMVSGFEDKIEARLRTVIVIV